MNSWADIAANSAEDEALRWLVDFEDLSEAEELQFNAWLSERPENRAAFEKVERDWRQMDVLQQLATAAPDPDVVNKWLWRRRLKRRYLPLAAAASIAVIAVALLFLPSRHYEASYRTSIGQHQEIRLPDDSVITLNTNSSASVYYSSEERRVHLHRGEAHFVITPAPEWPFSVVAGSGTVRAVGTAFNVYLKNDIVEVTVTEGVVEVRTNAVPVIDHETLRIPVEGGALITASVAETFAEGQTLEYSDTIESVSRMDSQTIARKLAWQDGMLDFQSETLATVIEEASRYTSTRISIEDPELEDLSVTGYFRAGDVDTLLELIESNDVVAIRRITPTLVHIVASRD